MAHVVKTLQDNLDEKSDPFYASFAHAAGARRRCSRRATWARRPRPASTRRSAATCCASTWTAGEYVPGGEKADEVYGRMLKKPAAERLKLLRESEGAQGQFLWAILRDSFHYAAVHLATIAESARDVDFAMRWGFGMKQGPFELWQEAGWTQVAQLDPGRHRRRQGAVEGAAARRGCSKARWPMPVACTRRKARGARPREQVRAARARCRCMRASCSPKACWAATRPASRRPAPRCRTTATCACGRWTARC